MAMRKGRDWFVVWMALLSYLIAQAESLTLQNQVSVSEGKEWYHILREHFDPQWLEALQSSVVCSFSEHTERAGLFLDVDDTNVQMQPDVKWFCSCRVPVWYPWDEKLEKNPKFSCLGPLTHQLQDATTTIARMPASSLSEHAVSHLERTSPRHQTWQQFLEKKQALSEERLKTESNHQKQVRLSRLQNPPKHSAKVFEWLLNSEGDLVRVSVSRKMREQTLGSYPTYQVYYDPIENEYDCCEEFDSGAKNVNIDDEDIDHSWDGDDEDLSWNVEPREFVDLNVNDNYSLTTREPMDIVEYDDAWGKPDPWGADNLISEILRVLRLFFGYTPLIPTPACDVPYLKNETEMKRFMRFLGMRWLDITPVDAFKSDIISAAADFVFRLCEGKEMYDDEWDFCSGNRESLCYSKRIKTIRKIDNSLFIFDFKSASTVPWKLTVTTAAHALLVCRLDDVWLEESLVRFLLDNGIPFHTLQLSSTLPRSLPTTLPPLCLPFRSHDHIFTWRDYCAFRQRCHDIFRQPRGRAALMSGHYIWRLATSELGFSSVYPGPSGWSTNPEEMLVVKIPETGE